MVLFFAFNSLKYQLTHFSKRKHIELENLCFHQYKTCEGIHKK